MNDLLKHRIPYYITDARTLYSYICTIRLSKSTIATLKRKFARLKKHKNDKYEVTYHALPSGMLHGPMIYRDYMCEARGTYIDNIPVGVFVVIKHQHAPSGERYIYYRNGVKSLLVKRFASVISVTRYVDGKKSYRMRMMDGRIESFTKYHNNKYYLFDFDFECMVIIEKRAKRRIYIEMKPDFVHDSESVTIALTEDNIDQAIADYPSDIQEAIKAMFDKK
jgi:hypothetical protein